MNVNDLVAARIEAARARIEATKRRRIALAAARQRGLAHRHAAKLRNLPPVSDETTASLTEGTSVTDRTLTPGALTALSQDIRDHGYAIVQTRIERVPARYRSTQCSEPDGCSNPPTLATLAVAAVIDDGNGTIGFSFVRDDAGELVRLTICDAHRQQASHDLYYELTRRTRPAGIRAFDVPGQHMSWA
ncbi:hypothetical protein AB0M94_06570 [Streptomyces xanthochromogenes]|uniref:hypothetical protein n=1 Tax=Streptomyces xanthochromogenes TaxID=67384 RepID=UPI0034449E3C